MPVDNMRNRFAVVEIRILLVRVAGQAYFGTHDRVGVLFPRMLGAHSVAVLALHVHEIWSGLLGRESPGLSVPDDVARQTLGRGIALVFRQRIEGARIDRKSTRLNSSHE